MSRWVYSLLATLSFTLALLQFNTATAMAGSNNCTAKTPPACNGDCSAAGTVCLPNLAMAGTPCTC